MSSLHRIKTHVKTNAGRIPLRYMSAETPERVCPDCDRPCLVLADVADLADGRAVPVNLSACCRAVMPEVDGRTEHSVLPEIWEAREVKALEFGHCYGKRGGKIGRAA